MIRFSFRSPAWTERDYWALDLETSGLDPRRAEVLSIGMVPIRGGVIRWGERWYSLVRPPAAARAGTDAVAVHELLPDELSEAPALAELLPSIAERLTGAVLVLHWIRLDLTVLRRAFRAAGLRWPRPKVVDTTALIARIDRRRRFIEPAPKATPTQLAGARAALDLPEHEEHHALFDALATAELFLALRARLGLERLRQIV